MEDRNNYQIYLEGERYKEDYLSAINSAKEIICLQTYIFKFDNFGSKVYESLLNKAKQGVKVNLTVDYIGTYYSNPKTVEKLRKVENFNITFFNPITTPRILQIGRRLHHKILIIDKKIAFIGGINVVDGSNAGGKESKLDFAIKIESEAIEILYDYCTQISQIITKKKKK